MFAQDSLQGMGKYVLYDTVDRLYLNWLKCQELIAYKKVKLFHKDIKKPLWLMTQWFSDLV